MPDGLPLPPPRLNDYTPQRSEIHVLRAHTPLWRLYKRQPHDTNWNTFRTYGPTDSRFDHHLTSTASDHERSILYAALDWRTCVAEVFQEDKLINTHHNEPRLVAFTFTKDIRLLDLTGLWPTRAGGSTARLPHRARARAWSRAIYAAFPSILGLYYNSRKHEGRPSYAFYERAEQHLADSPEADLPLSHPAMADDLDALASSLDYDIL